MRTGFSRELFLLRARCELEMVLLQLSGQAGGVVKWSLVVAGRLVNPNFPESVSRCLGYRGGKVIYRSSTAVISSVSMVLIGGNSQ